MVSIRYDCQHKNDSKTDCCRGTILTESYILTTADCIDSLPSDISLVDVTIVAGIHHRFKSDQIIRQVDRIIIHPNWKNDRNIQKHNIALLHLSTSLDFTIDKYITRICRSKGFSLLKDVLQYPSNSTRLLVMEWDRTKERPDTIAFMSLQQYEVGILNFVAEERSGTCLGIYTRLSYYLEWIESVLNLNSLTSSSIARNIDSITNRAITYKCNRLMVSCGCSKENVELSSAKIIGGEEAIPFSWSMIVSIRLNNFDEHSCAGTILTESYILTSAHCVAGTLVWDVSIAAGMHNRITDFSMIRYVTEIYIHPNWSGNDGTYRNDIAILRISPPLSMPGILGLTRICVPYINSMAETVNYPSTGSHLVIVGWGSTQYDYNSTSDTLQQTSIYMIDNNDPICQESIHDVEKQFCAGMSGYNPCQGDSGGPVFQWKGTYWEQVGIISHGGECNRNASTGIFTRLAYYFDWMESVIGSSLTTTTLRPPPIPTSYACNKTSSCGCGKADVVLTSSRIVGGENAIDDSWPMIVSLRLEGTNDHSCGGTILSNSYILTAAHCLRRISTEHPAGITIEAGMTNRSDPLQIIRNVDRIYMHPNYTSIPNDYRHDIALLHIDEPFVFESNSRLTRTCIHYIDPSISQAQYPKNGTRLVVIGWGVLRYQTSYLPEILQQAQVFTIDNQDPICLNSMNDSKLHFCAGLYEGGKDSCQGDSGGPIFQWTGQYWEQVGIVSYGKNCGLATSPGFLIQKKFSINFSIYFAKLLKFIQFLFFWFLLN
ncbi:unnamed protein product [Rotaria sp. Silwood1]|nr:unnamed protein product [Rotaria sp. Silwood1]